MYSFAQAWEQTRDVLIDASNVLDLAACAIDAFNDLSHEGASIALAEEGPLIFRVA